MEFRTRVTNVVNNDALRTILFNQVPDPNTIFNAIRENSRWARRDIKFMGYDAFATVVVTEAGTLLNETDSGILKFASSLLWAVASKQSKANYTDCAQAVDNLR
ncbi:11789_t:CDS:1 [Acaulospora morrowiae]|uniref:11789_t:CDS:1 n=1 Tax=Acaulospora morrowiae TaxID=94023 RepID=A0A9N9F6D4_9GLOM|nr:11789_t:CDS:1 [Acaulospora morrowiae]